MVLKNERRHKIHKRPLGIVIGEKGLDAGTFEYKGRTDAESINLSKPKLLY